MGILNVTPDSFSDGGKYFDKESAVKRVFELIDEGADIVDIGGESTRPGAEEVSVDEELKRTIPVIEEICKSGKNIFVSIDTTKPEVAEAALSAGALIVNDISGGEFYPKIHEIVNKMKAIYVLMHTTGKPFEMQKNINYKDITGDIYLNLISKANKLRANGLENIIIDPGIGFGKTVENNYEILSRLNEFTSAGYPLLTGVSRKSFLRKSLNIQIEDSDTASVIMDSFALQKGTSIIRTHNVNCLLY
ncbi:MAG: dihydropteroate synthase, partial [Ignavibacteriaceae bacterium]|nr:dihydropteroate synthase [Ignavibacteriaceae bacterium]